MPHRFLVKEIALQAGVSTATVDRVLNERQGVRFHTRQRVLRAIAELERQSGQMGVAGRKFVVDVVMEAPHRFSEAVRAAIEAELPALHPAVFRPRLFLEEVVPVDRMARTLDALIRRGSHGVILKAPDLPEIRGAVERLDAAGIPVVTLVTDLPVSRRRAYVGMDNRQGGATAAYLIGQWLPPEPAAVLVTLSSNRFRGEEEREIGFRQELRLRARHLRIVEVSEGHGVDAPTRLLVERALRANPDIRAVYSIGGGNRAVAEALDALGRSVAVFIGHDLDADNLALLRSGRLNAVLYHDLRQDMREACRCVLRAHGLLPRDPGPAASAIQIATPANVPAV